MTAQFKIRNFSRIVLILLFIISWGAYGQNLLRSTYSSFSQQGINDTIHIVGGQSMDNFTNAPQAFIGFLPSQSSLLSIDELETIRVTLYPNPFQSVLYCDLFGNNSEDNISIRLVSLDGKLRLAQKTVNSSFGLDLESFESGIYFLQIYINGERVSTHKLIKI